MKLVAWFFLSVLIPAVSANTNLDLISFLQAIPDPRMRRGVRIPSWYLLLVAVLGILIDCRADSNSTRGLRLKPRGQPAPGSPWGDEAHSWCRCPRTTGATQPAL